MTNFWDFNVWGSINLFAVLLLGLLAGNVLKRKIAIFQKSLIPTSVLGGAILLIIASVYKVITKEVMFDTNFFGGNGSDNLEMITYHALALGFIASTLKPSKGKLSKKRLGEIINTGVSTVSTYLLQAILGFGITLIIAIFAADFFAASGILLPFGYGQGTGQAMNYGNIFEVDFGFVGGKSFGLTIAAFGFISAAIGGVIHLYILKKRNLIEERSATSQRVTAEEVEGDNEIPFQDSIDKLTVQIALVIGSYLIAYLLMFLLGNLLPGMKSVIYGFNFLLGVLAATLVKFIIKLLRKGQYMHREYVNDFLLTRTSNFFFDIMVTAGIAAIKVSSLKDYWWILILLGLVGAFSTYFYHRLISKSLFKDYPEEQFLMMYGMLTGTASTGTILLREKDPNFSTPAAENMVYQNFPAIVLGFPMMLLVTMAPVKPILTMIILVVFFLVLNIVLFRSFIFKKKAK